MIDDGDGGDGGDRWDDSGASVAQMVRIGTPAGRWVLAATILASGIAFLDSAVVNGALPAIRRDLGGSVASQQWVATGYLLTLGSLLIVGGSLGDRFGRRRCFVVGLVGFAITSVLCGAAPTLEVLVAGRILKGAAAALLVPGSLAIIASVFHPDDRARAIGTWSGLAGISTALGPFVGGWLVDHQSWRWVFLINPVLAMVPIVIARRHVPESRDPSARPPDLAGGALLSLAFAGVAFGLIEGPSRGWPTTAFGVGVLGAVALAGFAVVELRTPAPMVPLSLFSSRTFSGANAATFVLWGGIGAVFFALTIHLQEDLGYSSLEAGAATIPVTLLIAAFASRGGALAQRIGARVPVVIGALTIATSFALLSQVRPGTRYATGVLPGVIVFGIGLAITIAPVTTAALAGVDERHAGLASAINNAVARLASLLVIAVLPALSGISQADSIGAGFDRAMRLCACLAAAGAAIALATLGDRAASERQPESEK